MTGGWAFDAGPLHIGSDGMGLRPQMKVGYADKNCDLQVGLDDLRDGISGGVAGHIHRIYTAEATSMQQVLKDLRAEGKIKVLDDVIKIAPQLLSEIVKLTRIDIPEHTRITASAKLKIGLGVSGGLCLGWADTKGYHMVGVRGSVSAAANVGADMMAGVHKDRKSVKAVLGISNVCVEMVFHLPEKAPESAIPDDSTPSQQTGDFPVAQAKQETAAAEGQGGSGSGEAPATVAAEDTVASAGTL